jgi:hypothetical protein
VHGLPARTRLRRRTAPSCALALAVLALCAHPALAGVYKCLRDDGRPFYQEEPCPPGRELRDFEKDPANLSVVPFAKPSPAAGAARKAAPDKHPPRTTADKPRHRADVKGDPAQRRFIRPGMSEAEVVARAGTPDMTAGRGRKALRWTYMPVPEDRDTITNVVFENGQVADVERKVIKK